MKEIPLGQALIAFVDEADYEALKDYGWVIDRREEKVYVKRYIRERSKIIGVVYLHRQIMGATDKSVVVDHRDGNPLNNQRQNLRLCSRAENGRNSKISKSNVHGFKGVSQRPSGRWAAYITFNRRNICLGTYDLKEDAARAYDNGAKQHHKEFASLNFPE